MLTSSIRRSGLLDLNNQILSTFLVSEVLVRVKTQILYESPLFYTHVLYQTLQYEYPCTCKFVPKGLYQYELDNVVINKRIVFNTVGSSRYLYEPKRFV